MNYKTLESNGEDEYIIKKSRFIGMAVPVTSEDEAKEFITKIKSKYHDARHNTYAYILKDGTQRYSDDREPSGTAGVPILEVLKKQGLVDACVVVTRYFGGILLGAGGLVRAYSHTASIALEIAGVKTMFLHSLIECRYNYSIHDRIKRMLGELGATVEDEKFDEKITMTAMVKEEDSEGLIMSLTELANGQIDARIMGSCMR